MEPYQISIIVAILLGILELLVPMLIFIGMAAGMFAVAMMQYVSGSYALNRDLLLWIIVSAIFVILFRKLFKKQSDQTILNEDDINQY
jgi:membrane protein implicated in regulation of membrane protease activity